MGMDFLMVIAAVVMMCSAYFILASSRSESGNPSATVYTVVSGDTLDKLAKRFYGSNAEWQRIYNANKRTLKNPHHLDVGTKLTIPPEESIESRPPKPMY